MIHALIFSPPHPFTLSSTVFVDLSQGRFSGRKSFSKELARGPTRRPQGTPRNPIWTSFEAWMDPSEDGSPDVQDVTSTAIPRTDAGIRCCSLTPESFVMTFSTPSDKMACELLRGSRDCSQSACSATRVKVGEAHVTRWPRRRRMALTIT